MKKNLIVVILNLLFSNLSAQVNLFDKKTRGHERVLYSTFYDKTNSPIILYDSTQYFYTQFGHFDLTKETFSLYTNLDYPYFNLKTSNNEFCKSLKYSLDSNQKFELVDSTIINYNLNIDISNKQIFDFSNSRYQGSQYSYLNSNINSIKDTFTNSNGSNIFHKEFIYDSLNLLIRVNEYYLVNNVDSLNKTDSLFYDSNNNLRNVRTYHYHDTWGWSKLELYNFFYDQNSNLTSEELYWWDNFGSYYDPIRMSSYEYDKYNRITNVYRNPSWNGSFTFGGRREFKYIGNNLYPDSIYMYYAQSPGDEPNINDVIETYLYNSNNLITEVKTFWLQTSQNNPVKVRKDYYENYNPPEVQQLIYNIEIFPNPCKSNVTIRNSSEINKLLIYDGVGNLISIYENNSGSNLMNINLSRLSNDLIVFKSFDKKGVLIHIDKILKQE